MRHFFCYNNFKNKSTYINITIYIPSQIVCYQFNRHQSAKINGKIISLYIIYPIVHIKLHKKYQQDLSKYLYQLYKGSSTQPLTT